MITWIKRDLAKATRADFIQFIGWMAALTLMTVFFTVLLFI